jgi:hypothetical protein
MRNIDLVMIQSVVLRWSSSDKITYLSLQLQITFRINQSNFNATGTINTITIENGELRKQV